jgi:hypothetical protein
MEPDKSQFPKMNRIRGMVPWRRERKAESEANNKMKANLERKIQENHREVNTRDIARSGDPVRHLDESVRAMGGGAEISGDAIARLKAGLGPKLHED